MVERQRRQIVERIVSVNPGIRWRVLLRVQELQRRRGA